MKRITYTTHKEYVVNVSEEKRFADQVALVTGGSGALGRAICLRLALEGAVVYVAGRSRERSQPTVDEVRSLGGTAEPIELDVTDESSVERGVAYICERHGRIDILVNSAGGSTRENNAPVHQQSIERIDEMLVTNLRGSMLCTKAVGRIMVGQKRGAIIHLASIIGLRGKAKFSDYAAAKAGIIGYTASAAIELGAYGIRVNCVSPGFIQRGTFSNQQLPYLLKSNCLNKVGTHEDVAAAVAFLASEDAAFVTGQNLCVDGGRSLGLRGDA